MNRERESVLDLTDESSDLETVPSFDLNKKTNETIKLKKDSSLKSKGITIFGLSLHDFIRFFLYFR